MTFRAPLCIISDDMQLTRCSVQRANETVLSTF